MITGFMSCTVVCVFVYMYIIWEECIKYDYENTKNIADFVIPTRNWSMAYFGF